MLKVFLRFEDVIILVYEYNDKCNNNCNHYKVIIKHAYMYHAFYEIISILYTFYFSLRMHLQWIIKYCIFSSSIGI